MESPLPQITASVCGLAELIIKVQFALTAAFRLFVFWSQIIFPSLQRTRVHVRFSWEGLVLQAGARFWWKKEIGISIKIVSKWMHEVL